MRGQQSLETILVVIVLSLILIFGIYFFARITDVELTEEDQEFKRDAVNAIAQQLSYLPELSCPAEGGEARICVDKIKAQLLSRWLNDPNDGHYSDTVRLRFIQQFGTTNIILYVTYPAQEEIVVLDATSSDNVQTQSLPVTIYDARTDTTQFGYLQVSQ